MKFDRTIRFAYLETLLYWEDGLTASDVVKIFKINRQSAQTLIEAYRQAHPGQIRYDSSLKRHVAEKNFTPRYIRGTTIDFLDYLRGQSLRAHYLSEEDWVDIALIDVDRKLRPQLPHHLIQPIFAALRHKKTVSIEYQPVRSKNNIQVRTISPNHLVFADNRYHLHAYCHVRNRHLDFVLSRILRVEPADEEWVSSENSREWNEHVILRFRPNPKLSETERKTLLRGYPGEEKGFLEIVCKKREWFYIKRKLSRQFSEEENIPLWIEMKELK